MSALVKIQNLDELLQTLEKIGIVLDTISSTLAYIARRMEESK